MDCDCEFDYSEPDGEESWHYSKTCKVCGCTWGALHCDHDRVQNRCPECRWIDEGKQTPAEILGL